MSLWRHPERRQLQPLRFNSLGKSEENLCRFAAADAVGEAQVFLVKLLKKYTEQHKFSWECGPDYSFRSSFYPSGLYVIIATAAKVEN